jgi:hypothetical protein
MGPSELLAALAYLVYEWGESSQIEGIWLKTAEAELAALVEMSGDAADMYLDALRADGAAALVSADGVDSVTYPLFLEVLIALQRLDSWHAPLRLADRVGVELGEEHEDALWRLRVEGGAYNPPGPFGSIIPPAPTCRWDPSPDRTSVIARVLHDTAYLPPATQAGNPDNPDNPDVVSDRVVELLYVACSPRMSDGRGPIDDTTIVAIAPVLQQIDDADLELRSDPDRYGVLILYDPARLYDIVAAAMAAGAHLLFLPEMSVDADQVSALASAIRRAAHAHRTTVGDNPDLRFVMAGVTHKAGGNSIVVLNVEGARILEQDKLCRWNLSANYQYAYGVRPTCHPGLADLKEDIPGGKTVYITDLEHFGRFLTMICADMDHDKPGDWLIRNVAVEWLHAPIMDRSIAWSIDKDGNFRPWIVARAHRATTVGVPKVIVTNSMLLTLRSNLTYSAPGSRYIPVTKCAVSFMLDKTDSKLTFRQITVDIPCPIPEVSSFRWREGFQPFPPPS